jgi:hypothetical protein
VMQDDIQPDVIHSRHAVLTPVIRAMTQPMDCPGTGRSHVWLYTLPDYRERRERMDTDG